MLVLPGLINAHHHGMAVSTVQLGFPDPGPPEPGLRDTALRVVDGDDARARRGRSVSRDARQGRAADRVRRHVAPAHALPVRCAGDGPPEDAYAARAARRRCARTANRASASRSRRTGATARAWPTTATSAFIASLPARAAGASARPRRRAHAHRRLHRDDPRPRSRARRRSAAERAVRDHGAAVGERRARRARSARRPRSSAPAIHLHALESRLQRAWGDAFAGGRELERLADAGVLGDRSALAHGVWLRDSDIELLARSGATVVHNCLVEPAPRRGRRPAPPARRRAASSVALGLDDMGIADDDDMLAEVRIAHVLQRVHGEAAASAAARRRGLRPDVGRRRARRRRRAGDRPARAGPARRCRRARSACAARALRRRRRRRVGAALPRGKAAHVDSVVVEGRVLMRGRTLQHLDRDALMAEVADAAASRSRGATRTTPWIGQLGRRIAEHYQAPVWHAAPDLTDLRALVSPPRSPFNPAPGCASLAP